MDYKIYTAVCCAVAALAGCWDDINHPYDLSVSYDSGIAPVDGGDTETDTDTDTSTGPGQGNLPEGWENLGAPCTEHADCTGYPRARCVNSSIAGVINAPGGYCTACCDAAGEWCADGIQCIGLDNVYLICAASCDSDDQCRQDEGWECRPIPPYLDTTLFPGNFCLPDDEHMEPDPDNPPLNMECDWPWVE